MLTRRVRVQQSTTEYNRAGHAFALQQFVRWRGPKAACRLGYFCSAKLPSKNIALQAEQKCAAEERDDGAMGVAGVGVRFGELSSSRMMPSRVSSRARRKQLRT
jgi:hypothetical protein